MKASSVELKARTMPVDKMSFIHSANVHGSPATKVPGTMLGFGEERLKSQTTPDCSLKANVCTSKWLGLGGNSEKTTQNYKPSLLTLLDFIRCKKEK